MEFYEVIEKRQSVRVFKTELIPEDVLNRVLEAFRAAPSWANTQPWELVLVKNNEIKEKLQKTLSQNNPAVAAVADAPLVVCPIGITGISGYYREQALTSRGDWVMFDLGIACQQMALAAAAEGLGTVHVGAFNIEKAGEILDIPPKHTVIELIPMGYPAYWPKKVPRKPLENFLYIDKYGHR
jgi:nitroreductase